MPDDRRPQHLAVARFGVANIEPFLQEIRDPLTAETELVGEIRVAAAKRIQSKPAAAREAGNEACVELALRFRSEDAGSPCLRPSLLVQFVERAQALAEMPRFATALEHEPILVEPPQQ